MHALTVVRTYLRLGLLNVLQYRADFVFQVIGIAISLATAVLTLAIVFGQTTTLNGWGPNELLALVGIQMLMRGLISMVIRPSMQRLMEGVRLGTFDFLLTKPADAQLLASVSQFNVASLADVVIGLGVIGVAMARLGASVGPGEAVLFVLLMLAGTVIVYCFLLMLSTCSFWFVKLDNILVIFNAMFEVAGRWPITIYPGWFRVTLTFLIPVAFAITVPAQSLTGRLDWRTTLLAMALAGLFAMGSRWFWRFGLRHYTGASA
jgi:ABC-2 type transport system permease protein